MPRRAALVLVVALVASSTLSGCIGIEFFLPQEPEIFVPTGDGVVRIWAAAKPGGLGAEFAHYNVSFGFMGHARDLYLEDIVPMRSESATVDLLRLAEGKTALLAELEVPPGEYWGFVYTTTGASLARKEVVGMKDGAEQTRIIEEVLQHRTPGVEVDVPTQVRVGHAVAPMGTVTDLYLEINVERSLIYENKQLRHHTLPHGVAVYVQGKKVGHESFDGGFSETGGGPAGPYGGGKSQFKRPWAEPNIHDPDTGRQYYSAVGMPGKRMHRTVGLGEDLRFDGSDSISYAGDQKRPRYPIIDWHWEFGDGTTGSGPVVVKNYTTGGLQLVTLTVTDDAGLVGDNHVTLFVPYTADEAETIRSDTRGGTIAIGSATAPTETTLDSAEHTLEFPMDLEGGALYVGGYRVTVQFSSLVPGIAGVTNMEVRADSGHFQGATTGQSPLVLETAGVPVWRGPLLDWVEPEITLDLKLLTGIEVDYTVTVEALYYANLSRGLDPHPTHLHGEWPFGPLWDHVEWDGTVRAVEDEE